MIPPRPKPREPFQPAADLEAQPFLLTRHDPPNGAAPVTLEDLSQQIGAVDRRVAAVQREGQQTRHELGELRDYVMADHAPRITAVEQRVPITIPPGVRKGALYTALVSLYPVLDALWPLARDWLASR